MAARLDHLILMVNDQQPSVEFYTRVLGFPSDGARGATSSVYFFDPSQHLIEIACYG